MSTAKETCFIWLTPPVPAAIAVVRCPLRAGLLDREPPVIGTARFARICDRTGAVIDETVVMRWADDQLDVMTHAGPGMRAAVTAALKDHGLREANLDEENTTDSSRWSALAHAACPAAVRWLLAHGPEKPPFRADFLRRSPVLLITGPTNAGKSTLLNAWCGRNRALVSDIPGTTRDLVAAETMVAGWRLRLLDSAGLRPTDDVLEQSGQALVESARTWVDAVLFLSPPDDHLIAQPGDILVHGKADLSPNLPTGIMWSAHGVAGRDVELLLADLGSAVLRKLNLPINI